MSTGNPAIAWARGSSSFEIAWPETTVRSESTLRVDSDESELRTEITLQVWEHDTLVHTRTWRTITPRP